MMVQRRSVVAGALALLVVCRRAAAVDPAAKAFLEKIYAAYKGKSSKGIALDRDSMLRLYFEPALAALMIKDRAEAKRRGDVPELDGDPFINGQDWDIGPVEITVADGAPDRASATVKFTNLNTPTTVVYDLVKLKPGWRIADITWPGNDSASQSLRAMYVGK